MIDEVIEAISPELQEKYFKQVSYIYHTLDIKEDIVKAREHDITKFTDYKEMMEILPSGSIVAGGYVTAAIRNKREHYSDIDVYSTSEKMFKETAYSLEQAGYSHSHHAKSYKGFAENFHKEGHKPVQLIRTLWFKSAEHVIDTFDFTVCQMAIQDGYFIYNPAAIMDCSTNKLIINRLNFPKSIYQRVQKYRLKGYKPTQESMNRLEEAMIHVNNDDYLVSAY